jgi:protein involved in polysaccharide export with SLBB domain
VKTYNILPNLELDSVAEKVKLKPYDQVYVRKNPTFELQQNITLQGLFKYEGTYSRLSKYERLSSYIERAGGLRDNANLGGAILFRNKASGIRENPNTKPYTSTRFIKDSTGRIVDSIVYNPNEPISIDLFNALKYKNSKFDLVLQEGDIVYVPEINPIVTVRGAVQSPLKIYFDKEHTNLSYYIDKAGGFSVKPWRKRIFVTYADGKSKRTHNFGFFHFYPKVEEGSMVIVPVKPEGKNVSDFAEKVLVSAMPIIVAYILTR